MFNKRVAIVGSGIAGLGCAHFLKNEFDITVFEKNDRIGGHVNTVEISERGKSIAIDTGFMVYNRTTYPNFSKLLDRLDVAVKPSDMSFSVQNDLLNIEWSGTGFKRIFARRSNLLNGKFWRFLLAVDRFNQKAKAVVEENQNDFVNLEQFASDNQIERSVLDLYIVPMMSALWSAPPQAMLQFPIALLARFMHSHGLLSIYDKLAWYTVDGGANLYVKALVAPFKDQIKTNTPIVRVTKVAQGVELETSSGEKLTFDKCILACHADEAMRMLTEESSEEKLLLSSFPYQRNIATLHTDSSVMPSCRGNWASWNYRIQNTGLQNDRLQNDRFHDDQLLSDPASKTAIATTHYWMNSLQGVSDQQNYFITIDSTNAVKPSSVLRQIEYDHPVFSVESLKAQSQLVAINKNADARSVLLCGSYSKFGFHEDAFSSAVHLCESLLGRSVWN
ncbi:MAG: FAD-dependent oxidoreductase [Candidatus Melainabacteria bacterium]|nr:FAD-dependent oxidoreductase [Candidatus Melainabacteria bacterium]